MDRILLDNGVDLNNVVIGVNNTSNTTDLFSPAGGGIAVPSSSLSADAVNDIWYYPTASIPQMGTNAEDRMAVLHVTQGVCDQVNVKANAANVEVTNYDNAAIGDPTANNDLGNLLVNGGWPTVLDGKMVGCIADTSVKPHRLLFLPSFGHSITHCGQAKSASRRISCHIPRSLCLCTLKPL